jgi:polysaccharide biosynthesis/export protein
VARALALLVLGIMLSGCAFWLDQPETAAPRSVIFDAKPEYVIGPGDQLQIFVWRNPDLTTPVPVRPDGRISIPLVQDVQAAGRTPSQLSEEIRERLTEYVKEPMVTVIVQSFLGTGEGRVSVVGEATQPRAVTYRAGLTLLDVMIESGGLTEFADGNDGRLVRMESEGPKEYRIRIADLMKDGDSTANVELKPGDIIRIPERWF